MPLLTEFKGALKEAVNRFRQKEGNYITTLQSQAIVDIEHLIDTIDSALTLREEITLKLRNIPVKSLAWVPFVNDLPKEIKGVLANPQFAENRLLISDCGDMRDENRQLRKENALFRQEFDAFKKSGMPQEIATAFQHVQEENIQLNAALSQKEKEIKLALDEKKVLEQSVVTLTEAKRSLEEELAKIKAEKDQLAKNRLQTLSENTRLKEANNRLTAELEALKKNQTTDNNTKQHSSNYKPSFQFS